MLDAIIDVKSSWDIFSYDDAIAKPNKNYITQGQVYLELYGRRQFILANVLVDATDEDVLTVLDREKYSWPGYETPEWREAQVIKGMVFTVDKFNNFCSMRNLGGDELTDKVIGSFVEIPKTERVKLRYYKKDEAHIQLAKARVVEAREYLKQFYAK